jgi:hypothetical protein
VALQRGRTRNAITEGLENVRLGWRAYFARTFDYGAMRTLLAWSDTVVSAMAAGAGLAAECARCIWRATIERCQ